MKHKLLAFLLIVLAFIPTSASAHVGVSHVSGVFSGFLHPLSGIDHLLAMIAVGIWARTIGGKAVWAVPVAFVGVMILGVVLGISGVNLPFVEQGIAASVLVLGLLTASAAKLPLSASVVLVSLFAVFHGHAHGAEIPATEPGLMYGAGFIAATVLLHLAGIYFGSLFQKSFHGRVIKIFGSGVATAGLFLLIK